MDGLSDIRSINDRNIMHVIKDEEVRGETLGLEIKII